MISADIRLVSNMRPYALPDEVAIDTWASKPTRAESHLARYKAKEDAKTKLNNGISRVPHLDAIDSRTQIGEMVGRTITSHSEVNRAILKKRVGGERYRLDPCDACSLAKDLGCTALVGITAMDNDQCAETRKPVKLIGTRGTIPMNLR